MNIDLECLKKLAKKATPGPWEFSGKNGYFSIRIESHHGSIIRGGANTTKEMDCSNMSYIAAINPDVTLALIAEIERLKALCNWDIGALKVLGILPADMTEENMDAVARDAAMQKLQEMEFKKIKRLEDEADWLADHIDRDPSIGSCPTNFTPSHEICQDRQCVQCWRMAAHKAVEASNA